MIHLLQKSLAIFLCTVLFVSSLTVLSKQTYAATSPLIFGTNLTLNDANDQFITSQATRDALKAMHVQLIRMPIRAVGGPSAWEVQAMQDIKTMGATPMIILKFSQTDPTGAAKLVLDAATGIFGTGPIYVEFGNERDLAGTTQSQYTTGWNQTISVVKPLYPHALFGGPVNFQQNPSYIAYFIQNANPAPDFISWHEYTCGNSTAAQICIDNIAHWATHITNTKSAIQATGKTIPPIFITEWNYDPNNPSGDSRATASFQTTFTKTALQELVKDGVTGATQYVSTGHTEYNLVDTSGQPTAEGKAFGDMYTQLIGGNGNISTTPTPTGGIGNGTQIAVTVLLHGIGSGGDNANASGKGTQSPKHTTRQTAVTFLNSTNQPVGTITGAITFNTANGNFTGTLDASAIPAGTYLVDIKTPGFLSKSITGTITINTGQINTIPSVTETTGDVNKDNQLDILDYNILLSCFGSKQSTASCSNPPTNDSPNTDINDDGAVNGVDYNLFLREMSTQKA